LVAGRTEGTGLTQLHLGRFEDGLATFQQADRFGTPEVSRWTWPLGAGWATLMLGRYEEALPWLERSLAITPASGRTYLLVSAVHQFFGTAETSQDVRQEGARTAARLHRRERAAAVQERQSDFRRCGATDRAGQRRRWIAGTLNAGSKRRGTTAAGATMAAP